MKHIDGWLDRRGKFYSCRFNHHNSASVKLEKKLGLKHSLEYLGWIKVHSAGIWFFVADSYCDRIWVKITESQKQWLLNNGYKLKDI